MNKDFIKCIINPQIFHNLYNNRIPSFDQIIINSIRIYPRVRMIEICINIFDLPDFPPKRWIEGYNRVTMTIDVILPDNLNIEGKIDNDIVNLNLEYDYNNNLSIVYIYNDDMNTRIKCHSVRISGIRGVIHGEI